MKNDGAGTSVRILIVDDHELFRRFIAETLEERPNLQVVAESQDGLDAFKQAEALQPDLILLDIGLPKLNGLEAARQISKIARTARIIFVTQESSPDIVREALGLGAWGYVLKVRAGKELLIAVEAVIQGKQFVSSGLDGHATGSG